MRSPSTRSRGRGREIAGVGAVLVVVCVAALSCVGKDDGHVEVSGQSCVSCHRPEFLSAEQPVHNGVFPETCGECHAEDTWKPAHGFDHDDFPLEAGHADVTCMTCHMEGFEPGQTPRDCVGCHLDDYQTSPFPGHDTFARTCMDCHSTSAWKPATGFEHNAFALEGGHANVTCMTCHTEGYEPGQTPRECVGCHLDDFQESPYPGHQNFARTCVDCHTTSAWKPATGGGHPEDKFPILSGKHDYECNDCHNSALGIHGKGNADCVGCHDDDGTHSRAKMDPKHDEVSNYPAGSAPPNFCLDCHPAGRKEED